jgi:hypothetical protein
MTQNQNQFQQAPIPGQLDLQVTAGGLLSGMIAASVSGSLKAGTPVKLDPDNTGPVPKFILADDDDPLVFILPHSDKQDSYAANAPVEVPVLAGPVLWGVAGAQIHPGVAVEQANTTFKFIEIATHKARGIALDPAAADGDLFRYFLMPVAAIAS